MEDAQLDPNLTTTAPPRALLADRRGAVAAEAAVLLPFLTFIVMAIIQFGLAMNADITLTDAAAAAAREFAVGRDSNTAWTDARARFNQSLGMLNTASATVTLSVNGTNCTSDVACRTALTNNRGANITAAATYPCNLRVLNINFMPSCTLRATVSGRAE